MHTNLTPEWDFQDLVRNGMIPQPFSSMSKLLPSPQPNETKNNNANIPSPDYGICG